MLYYNVNAYQQGIKAAYAKENDWRTLVIETVMKLITEQQQPSEVKEISELLNDIISCKKDREVNFLLKTLVKNPENLSQTVSYKNIISKLAIKNELEKLIDIYLP